MFTIHFELISILAFDARNFSIFHFTIATANRNVFNILIFSLRWLQQNYCILSFVLHISDAQKLALFLVFLLTLCAAPVNIYISFHHFRLLCRHRAALNQKNIPWKILFRGRARNWIVLAQILMLVGSLKAQRNVYTLKAIAKAKAKSKVKQGAEQRKTNLPKSLRERLLFSVGTDTCGWTILSHALSCRTALTEMAFHFV